MPQDSDDALDRLVQKAFVRTNTALGETHADLVAVAATVQALVDLLVQRGVLDAGELAAQLASATRRLEESELASRNLVKVADLLRDKYREPSAPVDCDARMPLCRGACCACAVPLATQDVEEGILKWNLARPYYLRKGDDGRCVHQVHASGMCGVYERRPLTCRTYTCEKDRRIWLDFEARIPNTKGITGLLEGRAQRSVTLRGHKSAVPIPVPAPGRPADEDA